MTLPNFPRKNFGLGDHFEHLAFPWDRKPRVSDHSHTRQNDRGQWQPRFLWVFGKRWRKYVLEIWSTSSLPLANFIVITTLSKSLMLLISGIMAFAIEWTSMGYSPKIQVTRSISCTAQSWNIPPDVFKYSKVGKGESRLVVLMSWTCPTSPEIQIGTLGALIH